MRINDINIGSRVRIADVQSGHYGEVATVAQIQYGDHPQISIQTDIGAMGVHPPELLRRIR